jgi:hypothetical protein
MAWRVTGQSIELCSCRLLCPCWLSPDVEPDQGWCSGAFVFGISEGNSDEVDLAGCKVAIGLEWPGNFWAGNGTARLYIDGATTAEQRRELEAIFGGQKGGPLATVLPAIITNVLPTQVTKIDIQWGDNPSITVDNVASLRLQPLKNQAGGRTKVQGAIAMAAFQLESMDLASSKGSRWSDPELRPWQGDSGTLHVFNWSG